MSGIKSYLFEKREVLLVLVLLIIVSSFFFSSHFFEFPSHTHAWTQSDRYALAVGYAENGLNPFLPSTSNLFPKYPPNENFQYFKGYTSAALALPEFLAAVIMRVSGIEDPVILRTIVLLSGLIALLFLFVFMKALGSSFVMSLLMVVFVFSAPVFTYYMNGFIPGIPALSLSFAAFYFYVQYLKKQHFNHFVVSLFLLTLAAMIRPPFLMPLVAVIVTQLFFWKSNKLRSKELFVIIGNLVLFSAFWMYDKRLQGTFGSMFNNELMPAANFSDWGVLMQKAWSNWNISYLTYGHYVLLIVAFLLLVFYRKKLVSGFRTKILLVTLLNLGASLMYSFVMAQQFPAHDYYFLDSFFLPLVIFTSLGLSLITVQQKKQLIPLTAGLLVFSSFMLHASNLKQNERYTTHSWDRTETTRLNFIGSEAFLKECKVEDDARILVLDAYTSNVPLLLMNRKGFTVIETTNEFIQKALTLPFEHIVIQNKSLSGDVLRNFPELAEHLYPVANNGRIGLYNYTEKSSKKSWLELLLPVNEQHRINFVIDTTVHCIGLQDDFYPLKDTIIQETDQALTAVLFQAQAYTKNEKIEGLNLVIDAKNANGFTFYDSYPLSIFFEKSVKQTVMSVFFQLPLGFPAGTRVKVYIWNPGKNEVCFQNQAVLFTKYSLHI